MIADGGWRGGGVEANREFCWSWTRAHRMRTIHLTAGLPRRLDGKMQVQIEGWATRQHSPCSEGVAAPEEQTRSQHPIQQRAPDGGRSEVVLAGFWWSGGALCVGELRPALDLPANSAERRRRLGVRPRRLRSHALLGDAILRKKTRQRTSRLDGEYCCYHSASKQ